MSIYEESTHTPYTYFIRWSKLNTNYYGVRYAKNCHPSDFLVNYFTSSTKVKEYIKTHGVPDIIQIRKIFHGPDRISKARIWEHKVLKRLQVVNRPDFLNASDGRAIDPELSSRARTGVAPGNKGKPQPDYIKDKKRKPKPIIICPCCGKSGGISAMTRWHFDKCGSDANRAINEKIAQVNQRKSQRPVVQEIKQIRQSLSRPEMIKMNSIFRLKPGWYQLDDQTLANILTKHQQFICRP